MLSTLNISRQQFLLVNWKAVLFFYLLACVLSYSLNFLPNLNPWFLPRHSIFTYGLGPIGSAFITRLVFPSVPRTITWTGTKPGRTALFVAVPLVIGTAFGLVNKLGHNPHLYGFLFVMSSILYGLVEEAGWRGFLQDALRPLPTVWRILLIATLWLGWHFTFLPDLSAVAGPRTPFWGICGLFILASWGFGNAAERTKAVLVVACLHEAGNLVGSPVALGIIALCWTLLLIFWNRPVAHRLILNKRSWFGRLAASCLTATLLLGAGHVIAQTDSAYSAVPHGEILLDQPNPFPVFNKAFYENQLFLLGEVHGMQKPQELDFALLRHLNERVGVRFYIAEVDAVKARYLNEYLKTGDTLTLNKVFRSWVVEKMQWANRDFRAKIQRIRVLNQTLPEARRIQFVGIDRIQDKPLAAERLTELLRGQKLPKTAQPLIDSVVSGLAQNRPDSVVANAARLWLDDWQTAPARYRRAFGRDTAMLRQLLTNVLYLKTIKSREKTIFANFQTLLPSLNNEKLYGFWGFFHVLQQPTLTRAKPFACLVKESGISVVSITCSYLDSYMMLPGGYRTDKLNNDSQLMRTEGIDAMRAATRPNTLTLFALDRPGSFARHLPIRIRYGPFMPPAQRIEFDPKRSMTDYFQYVVLIRNSDMTQPLVP